MNPNKLDSHDSNGEISCFAKKKQFITSGMTRVVMISIVKVTIIINTFIKGVSGYSFPLFKFKLFFSNFRFSPVMYNVIFKVKRKNST